MNNSPIKNFYYYVGLRIATGVAKYSDIKFIREIKQNRN